MEGFGTNLDIFIFVANNGCFSQPSVLFEVFANAVDLSESEKKELKQFCQTYVCSLRNKWISCNRTRHTFIKKYDTWLQDTIKWPQTLSEKMSTFPSTSGTMAEDDQMCNTSDNSFDEGASTSYESKTRSVGTSTSVKSPRKQFSELSPQQKRRRVQELLACNNCNTKSLAYATGISAASKDVADIIKLVTDHPEEATEIKRLIKSKKSGPIYSTDKALGIFTSLKLSKWQYVTLRACAKEEGIPLYPSYTAILEAKKECYPPKHAIEVTETGVRVRLQAILDKTVMRLCKFLRLESSLQNKELTLTSKWGFDGASGQSLYKQTIEGEDDSSIFMCSFVPLRLVCGEQKIWENPKPSSTMFCRPLYFKFANENNIDILEEQAVLEAEIGSLEPSIVGSNAVKHSMLMTMIDGKITSKLSKTSTQTCDICKATPTEMNNLDNISKDVRFNRIFDIAPGAFSQLHRLRSLLLNDNQLRALRSGVFHGLRRLKYLYLYRNRIQHIDSDVFQGMAHLEQLYLHVNEIHQIVPETFSHLPRLERLYLHNNHLKTIPPGSFRGMPKLRKLRLDSNALICDCSMLWFVRMLAEHSEMNIAATCYEPADATGISLSTMTANDFHCKQPEIEKEPEDAIVHFGEDAVFSCVAKGEPAPEIVWFRDSDVVPLDITKYPRYELMDNGTLMVHEADEKDVGIFECTARNPAGEVRSKPARMIVQSNPDDNGYPVFTILPRKQIVKINQRSVQFDCVAKGNPPPHISWLFEGERILLTDRISMSHNGSIFIENVQDSDAGLYTCEANNKFGKITASASLEVMVSPAFLTVPNDITVTIGDTAEFTCVARGIPKPTISWYRNTMVLPPGENIQLTNDNQNLKILEVGDDDAGLYHCRAENSEGLTEISAVLKVKLELSIDPPKIVLKPEDTDAFRETSVQMPCEYESEQEVTVEWRKNGNKISISDRIQISVIGSLIINNLTITDTGKYECSVYNKYGRDSASAFLTVKDRLLPGDEYVNIALTEATRDVDQAISRTIDQLFNNGDKTSIKDLYKIVRFPNAPAREVARAAEIYERTLDKVKGFIQTGMTITSTEPFKYEQVLSPAHLEVIARLSGCVAHRILIDCSKMCFHLNYRTIDGRCNNFANPTWGSSLTGFRRILYPIYENGFSQPVGWNKDIKYNGHVLPSARLVSTEVISTTEISQDVIITHMTMQWGQWLDHDLDHSLPAVSSQTWDGVDCKKTCDYAPPCFPIDVPANDTRITNRRCIDFIRTSAVCGSGMTSVLFGTLQPREQINQLTSFIDASQVYGFEQAVADDLRDLSNENGLLRVGAQFPGKKPLLPTTGLNAMDCRRNLEESTRNCFVAGDIRANEQIGLAAMHTIWMREHNRIATELKRINPFWDGEKIYQEARKIVGAETQAITYQHWLPLIIGSDGMNELGEYKGYNSQINPSVSNVFATAAFRFGHSLINPILHRYDENFETIPQGHLLLRHAFFSPWRLVDEGGVDPLIRGLFTTPAKLKTPKQNLNSELTEKLFHTAHAVALDLAAINIQRSRDHAIPPYTKWRGVCNMSEVETFDDLANEISDKTVRDKLQQLYGSVHNIDVWVGGILEDQVEGGKVGPLFRCLLIEQFKRLRDGDRFYYENPSMFKPDQLHQIRRVSLARVLCDNGDMIDTIGENVFLLPEVQDGLISCEDLPAMDLRFWSDCESCNNVVEEKVRSRRDTSSNHEELYDHLLDTEERMDILVDVQTELERTIKKLKKRISSLEEKCERK